MIATENTITVIAPIQIIKVAIGPVKSVVTVVSPISEKPAAIAAKYKRAKMFIITPPFILILCERRKYDCTNNYIIKNIEKIVFGQDLFRSIPISNQSSGNLQRIFFQ